MTLEADLNKICEVQTDYVSRIIKSELGCLDNGHSRHLRDLSAEHLKKWLEYQKEKSNYFPTIERQVRRYYSIYERIKRIFK